MGKAVKVKAELTEATEMVYLIQTLKDIADNKYFSLLSKKDTFRRFGETFVEFFRMISLTSTEHPLLHNDNSTVAVIIVTIEGSFLGKFNRSITRMGLKQKDKHNNVKFIAVGERSIDTLKLHDPNIKVFERMDRVGLYETAVAVKDYIIEEIMNNRIGKVLVCYSWPKNFEVQKTRLIKLLPCDELILKQSQYVDEFEHIIEESDPKEIVGFLANLWVTTRLYEIFMDTNIASAAAQANFLEESIDRQNKNLKKTKLRFRKARKEDIDKALRETFSARMVAMK